MAQPLFDEVNGARVVAGHGMIITTNIARGTLVLTEEPLARCSTGEGKNQWATRWAAWYASERAGGSDRLHVQQSQYDKALKTPIAGLFVEEYTIHPPENWIKRCRWPVLCVGP
jgi:hypothetical protein